MNLHDYLRVLRRSWWVLVFAAALGGGLAAFVTVRATPVYQATADALIATPASSIASIQIGNQFAQQRAATYAQLVTTASVLQVAAQDLGGTSTELVLSQTVTAAAQTGSAIITITASADTPQLAADRANAVATALNDRVQSFEVASSSSQTPVQIQVVQAATPPTTAISPTPTRNIAIGIGAGFVLGIALVVLLEALTTRIRSPRDLAAAAGRAASAVVPDRRGGRAAASLADNRREVFRTLRASLRPGSADLRSIAIASVGADHDSTEVAVELARAIAESGLRVVIVDANLRPAISRSAKDADPRQRAGLADVLEHRTTLDQVLIDGPLPNMATLPPGAPSSRSAQLLSTKAMQETVAELAGAYSVVLLTCPPLLARSDSAIIAGLADATVAIVDSRHTTRSEVAFALEMLRGVGVHAPHLVLYNVRRADMVPPRVPASTAG